MLFLVALVPLLVVQAVMLWYLVDVGRRFRQFVNPRGGEASDLALAMDALTDRVILRMKMTVLGEKGGDAKSARAAEQGMMRDFVTSQNPVVALALDNFMPKWAKYFAANPELMGKGLEMMRKYSGPNPTTETAGAAESNGVAQFPLEI